MAGQEALPSSVHPLEPRWKPSPATAYSAPSTAAWQSARGFAYTNPGVVASQPLAKHTPDMSGEAFVTRQSANSPKSSSSSQPRRQPAAPLFVSTRPLRTSHYRQRKRRSPRPGGPRRPARGRCSHSAARTPGATAGRLGQPDPSRSVSERICNNNRLRLKPGAVSRKTVPFKTRWPAWSFTLHS